MGSKYAKHKPTKGLAELGMVQLATRVQEKHHQAMRVYCVSHQLAIQDFIAEAITLRLKKR